MEYSGGDVMSLGGIGNVDWGFRVESDSGMLLHWVQMKAEPPRRGIWGCHFLLGPFGWSRWSRYCRVVQGTGNKTRVATVVQIAPE